MERFRFVLFETFTTMLYPLSEPCLSIDSMTLFRRASLVSSTPPTWTLYWMPFHTESRKLDSEAHHPTPEVSPKIGLRMLCPMDLNDRLVGVRAVSRLSTIYRHN